MKKKKFKMKYHLDFNTKQIKQDLKVNEGFAIVYAKSGSSPKNIFLETKIEVINFFIDHLDEIDFLSLNDIAINKNNFLTQILKNVKISRYLKLKKLSEL